MRIGGKPYRVIWRVIWRAIRRADDGLVQVIDQTRPPHGFIINDLPDAETAAVARGVWRQAPQMNGHPRDAWRRRPGQNPAYRPAGPLDCSRAGLFAGGNEMNIQNGSPNMEMAKDWAFQDVERVDASTGARRSTVLRPA